MFGRLFGGKPRSKLGKFLDRHGVSQEWLVDKSKVNRNTISKLASGTGDSQPTLKTVKKIMKAIRQIDPNAKTDDFFDI